MEVGKASQDGMLKRRLKALPIVFCLGCAAKQLPPINTINPYPSTNLCSADTQALIVSIFSDVQDALASNDPIGALAELVGGQVTETVISCAIQAVLGNDKTSQSAINGQQWLDTYPIDGAKS